MRNIFLAESAFMVLTIIEVFMDQKSYKRVAFASAFIRRKSNSFLQDMLCSLRFYFTITSPFS